MSEHGEEGSAPAGDALRARRAELRRRHLRRRIIAVLTACALVGAAVAGVLLATRSGTTARAARIGHQGRSGAERGGAHRRSDAARRAAVNALRENSAIDRLLTRQPFIRSGGPERREIALTFDDGPGPYTAGVLAKLRRLHAPATFFEVGFMFRWFRSASEEALRMGDAIGDHTETHPRMALLPSAAQRKQILDETQWVQKDGGPFPRLWRPPYGSYDAATLAVLHQLHMLMVLWTADTDDYLRPGVPVIVHRALAGARPGAIILLHDGGGDRTQTIKALPLIVQELRKRGYELVTVPRLIVDDPPLKPETLPVHMSGD